MSVVGLAASIMSVVPNPKIEKFENTENLKLYKKRKDS